MVNIVCYGVINVKAVNIHEHDKLYSVFYIVYKLSFQIFQDEVFDIAYIQWCVCVFSDMNYNTKLAFCNKALVQCLD